MINITFPDSTTKQFNMGITGLELASQISQSLAKEAIVIEVDGKLQDLSVPIELDVKVRILTSKDSECLELIRHDAAHILAEAVKELFPETQVTIGPAVENGFYYDFARDNPFTIEDLVIIEEKMREIVQRDEKITREIWDRDDAISFFKSTKEYYKAEIIESIPNGEKITLYKQGNFIDLCRGPHAPSTSKVKHFKLLKVAGAYWRGDSRNPMLQRIYGTAWLTKDQLNSYLHMLEEAEKRDHRKIGKELELFHFQEEAQGMPFWHKNGWSIYRTIEQYIRNKLTKHGYIEIKTPILVNRKLWEASGHWEKFGENMFSLQHEDEVLALKPMSCPCHVQVFNQGIKSYRDLPIRIAEFGLCHRNEASGALHGLMRVRSFNQDDAHIFCTEDQVESETVAFYSLLTQIYKDFGFNEIKIKFSDRPPVRAGTNEIWDKAEQALKNATKAAGFEYILNPGDGAFYGPKLDFYLKDAIGREWQCGTLQLDFVLPERLKAFYISPNGEKRHPVMMHRAIIGTFERFIGILIENYAGNFPLWLTPVQIAVITITNEVDNFAKTVYDRLLSAGVRTELDVSSEKVNYKVRKFSNKKIPLIAVIGKQEVASNTVNLRKLGATDQEVISVQDLITLVQNENIRYMEGR